MLDALFALSPLDGRYAQICAPLRTCFSEAALIRARLQVELLYLDRLLTFLEQPRPATWVETLEDLQARLQGDELILAVKACEAETRHDVKAVEYVLADVLIQAGLQDMVRWLHWGLTSEDINNLAWGILLQRALKEIFQPLWLELLEELKVFIQSHAELPMLARTHGQPASPTTVGKEYAVFAHRLLEELKHQQDLLPVGGKQNGATGNWHVFEIFFPERDWQAFSQAFVSALGLAWEPLTTQIVVRERYARIFDSMRRLSNILMDAARDTWFYVAQGYFQLKRRSSSEVGSSTMPHKVNPVLFENAEGNFELACVLLDFLSNKLTKSRLQRDLSDSTAHRNVGVALGHVWLGIQSFLQGLRQLDPCPNRLQEELTQHFEVLAEPLQHALRLAGREIPYEQIRQATQGKQLDQVHFQNLLTQCGIHLPVQTPAQYTGQARRLAEQTVLQLENYLQNFR